MTEQQIKEKLSESYLELLINKGGFKKGELKQDHGVDLLITRAQRIVRSNGDVSYRDTLEFIGVQLKCTCQSSIEVDGEYIKYDLEAKNYNDLIDSLHSNSSVPLLLVLMVLPDEVESWVEVREHEIALTKCAYWYRPNISEPITENVSTKRIYIPATNKLDLNFIGQQFANFF